MSVLRSFRSTSVVLLCAGITLPLFSASAAASTSVEGGVHDAAISPDGRWVVYVAEQDTLGVKELYSVPLDGSAGSVKLSGPTQGHGRFLYFSFTPDGLRVVYTADEEHDSLYGLYSVPIAGGAAVQLVPGGDDGPYRPSSYRISADGRRVVLVVGDELLSIPIDGSSSARAINADIPPGPRFEITPDSRRVAFVGTDVSGAEALYSVSIDSGPNDPRHARRRTRGPIRLTPFPLPGGHVWSLRISSNSRRVVYRVRDGSYDIYSVPIDGSAKPVKLSSALVGGVHPFWNLDLSPDGMRVLYVADQEQDQQFELYSVPIDRSAAPVKLNGPLVAGGDVLSYAPGFEISADGSRVVYRADQETDGIDELYGVPIDASSAPVKLNAPLVAGEDLKEFLLSPDGSRVVYLTAQHCNETLILRSVPIDGSSPAVQINDPHVGGCSDDGEDDHLEYRISPDGARVVYVSNNACEWFLDLYGTPIDGDASDDALNLPPSGHLADDGFPFAISPDGSQVVFGAFLDGTSVLRLYRAPIDGSAHPLQLNR